MDTLSLLKKLNFRPPTRACVLGAPPSFLPALEEMNRQTQVDGRPIPGAAYDFALAFCERKAHIATHFNELREHLAPDAVLYFAYPKKSSKQYRSDISRDEGWEPLGEHGYEGVRMVSIDEDWSALRLRHADHIKTLRRDSSRTMSEEGKKRTKG